jgi:hypothetical protein
MIGMKASVATKAAPEAHSVNLAAEVAESGPPRSGEAAGVPPLPDHAEPDAALSPAAGPVR